MPRIAVCAPSTPFTREEAARIVTLAAPFPGIALAFHEQCFASAGHFAGDDATRLAAFLDCANDPGVDGVWFVRGGYGAGRIAEGAIGRLAGCAGDKVYLGYSDAGCLLAGLYRARTGRPAHGPMPVDIRRAGGEAAVLRALAWFAGEREGEEPSLGAAPAVAFNLMTLAMLTGTPLMPDLAGHVVMVEEVSEHHYAIDRLFFHLSHHLRGAAGLRLGRVSEVPVNDRAFGCEPEDIARYWCERAGIPFLGTADIGHDAANKIVPFGPRSGLASTGPAS
jgi:muramoyltetrapeptide carboxypeptidase